MKKKIKSWDLKTYWDDSFFAFANLYLRLRYLRRGGRDGHGLPKNIELKDKHKGKRVFVLGNGPSIKGQDLTLLKNEVTFFVNRAFLHEDYHIIEPTYHIFVDPKLANGEWPVIFLDEVAEKNPNVTFLLNGGWYKLPKFQEYKRKYEIYWLYQALFLTPFSNGKINLTRIGVGGAVVEQGILAAIYMGAKDIYFLGVDGNGLCYNIIERSSHFYGTNPEDLRKDYKDIYRDLDMMSTSLRRWEMMGRYFERIGVNLVNLTDGGIIDICPRMRYEDVLDKSSGI